MTAGSRTEVSASRCTACLTAGRDHHVEERPAGVTDASSHWGVGVPVTRYTCTTCGAQGQGMVSADVVGDVW